MGVISALKMYSFPLILMLAPMFTEWFVDEKLNMCMAKNCCKANREVKSFSDYAICQSGLAMDQFSCGGGVEHKGMCENIASKGPSCPKGQRCIWGPFGFGFCCDAHNEEVWHKEFNASCTTPLKRVTISNEEMSGDKVLRGKSCTDHFCPRGSKCVQGRYIAHCCA
ncbi:hypothetical protein PMAYCL1PPCAC_30169 [Pristionchus mayeri]|uniref:Uncharacterized protein n=1 Tax=Pristionchus mayeri TaxID=1317129 RepID=A0AAN5DBE1_9BILA|nr:hypothetical protein PMAYCL1PPCAC_30169 [Pristionchus mayeri]